RGGHTSALLESGVNVLALDQDAEAEAASVSIKERWGDSFHFVRENFRAMKAVCESIGWESVDGILLDLGVSSPQFDEAHRGFSFRMDGPLDMRMDARQFLTAARVIAGESESGLSQIFWELGEDRDSRRIARAIVKAREEAPIETTKQLADLVSATVPWRKARGIHPATQVFQALRLKVNDEIGVLEEILPEGTTLLAQGGRFAVISFHSGEDRRVKRFFQRHAAAELENPKNGWLEPNTERWFEKVKRYLPDETEQEQNPRSRSARLRVAWKKSNKE
ncbi:MAG: 16S rRNA (cytosine(1402)-N(4))-methyltransferase RsmH, partial [Verrucomicrobiota bacterium]